VRHWLIADG